MLLEEKFNVYQKLVQLQNENKIEGTNTIMITECTFLRHHILEAISMLGGPGERSHLDHGVEKIIKQHEQVINNVIQILKESSSKEKLLVIEVLIVFNEFRMKLKRI